MKTRATIILFLFAAFFAETITFPAYAEEKCKKMSCEKMMGKMKCSHKKDDCGKSPGKCNSGNCTICPVCSIFTFQSPFALSETHVFITKNYPRLNAGDISSFNPDIWKPPNSYLSLR